MESNGRTEGRRLPSVYVDRWIQAEQQIIRANERFSQAVEQAERVLKIETEQARVQIEHCRAMLAELVQDGPVRALRGPSYRLQLITLRPSAVCGVELFHRHVPDLEELDWPAPPIPADAVTQDTGEDDDGETDWTLDDVVTIPDASAHLG